MMITPASKLHKELPSMPTTKLVRHITDPASLVADDSGHHQQGSSDGRPPVLIATPVVAQKAPKEPGFQRQVTGSTADLTDNEVSSSSFYPTNRFSSKEGGTSMTTSGSSLVCLEDTEVVSETSEDGRLSPPYVTERSSSHHHLSVQVLLDAERPTDEFSQSSEAVRNKVHAMFKPESAKGPTAEQGDKDALSNAPEEGRSTSPANSVDLQQEEEDRLLAELPRFDMRELKLGKFLGRGGFSDVEEIRAIMPNLLFHSATHKKLAPAVQLSSEERLHGSLVSRLSQQDYTGTGDVDSNADPTVAKESRAFIAKHCIRHSGEARYALKHLQRSIQTGSDRQRFRVGILDLTVETQFLSRLEHPNIIKLRAISSADPYSSDYFLILDRLYDTLHTRILKWKKQHAQNKKKLVKRQEAHRQLRADRLLAAYDLSAAIDYLHEYQIIHRDLKPDNIGFDVRGDIKIFDFGLAYDLRKEEADKDGAYLLSNMTGSLRYMAPEVGLGRRYNEKCDVYSFTLVFWEMLALERPYLKFKTEQAFLDEIFARGRRPKIKAKWPEDCKKIMEGGWHADHIQRHSMVDVHNLLRRSVVDLRDGESDVLNLTHHRRRSTFVFKSLTNGGGNNKPTSRQFSSASIHTSGSGSGQFAHLQGAFSSRRRGD